MILTFRPIDQWPDGWRDPRRSRSSTPFTASYQGTLRLLDREVTHLKATTVFLQVDADPGHVRLDGQLRADARVNHPGVILTVDTKKHGVLVYPCDAFTGWQNQPGWQANLRAIALGLEALRRVERYGIANRGQQYAGFGALPPARAMGAGWTVEQAAAFVAEHAWGTDVDPQEVLDDLEAAFRAAAKHLHPDTGGDPELFRKLTEARELLEAHG